MLVCINKHFSLFLLNNLRKLFTYSINILLSSFIADFISGNAIPVLLSIFIVAILYSSVGHGGASGYLAVMTIFSFNPQILRSSALLLNLFVSGIAFLQYYRKGYFKWNIFLPFAITSVPFAFLGGMMTLDTFLYKKILGFCLLFAVFRMILNIKTDSVQRNDLSFKVGLVTGAVLGFVSGIIGVGGGIFLSPLLLLLHWADMKETAAVSALFIFVNSAAGLTGILSSGLSFSSEIFIWVPAALLGGIIGSYMGSFKVSGKALRYVLSVVLLFASVKLFFY